MPPELRSRPLALAALVVLFAYLAVALFAPALAPFDPQQHDPSRRLAAPSLTHPMGTDGFGRDQLSRVMHGARASLGVAVAGVVLAALLGVGLGTASGHAGGRLDLFTQRLADTLLAFPAVVMALVLVAAFGPSSAMVGVAVVLAFTPQLARVARARALELKQSEHVAAARALGASEARIVWRHLLPHVLPAVMVVASGYLGSALVLEAVLSYLGLGLPPPAPSWGRMIFEGAHLYLETAPWLTVFPGAALSLAVVAAALLSDALRDILDPRTPRALGRRG